MATPTLTVYDFDQVTCVISGIPIDGFDDGEGISIEQTTESFTHVTGSDGKTVRSKTLDRTAKIMITLLQTSAANDLLSLLHTKDLFEANGAGVGPMLIRDRNGRANYSAAQCWISKRPDVKFDRTPTPRVWEITCVNLVAIDGGS